MASMLLLSPGYILVFSFFEFFFLAFYCIMSLQKEVKGLLKEADDSGEPAILLETIRLAKQEVGKILKLTGDSMLEICKEMESATTRDSMKAAFRRFNDTLGIFLKLELGPSGEQSLCDAVCSLKISDRLEVAIRKAPSLIKGCEDYKASVLEMLGASIRREKRHHKHLEVQDDILFSKLLPEPSPPAGEVRVSEQKNPSAKRSFSETDNTSDVTTIPKKVRSSIPALASLHLLTGDDEEGKATKKSVLVTRERLRAGVDDPKGLLNLVDSSTNALEQAKKLELLKNAGLLQKTKGKSFSNKLKQAIIDLDLGLGGQRARDTLLFGAKVLSTPGFLSNKNISDIENSVVEGNTTWKHQNAFAKMMIAGCLNQSKRIVEKFDEILHVGVKPEVLVHGTHATIRQLLRSDEGSAFLRERDSSEEAAVARCDTFIKRIVEAVAPILPITLRNKALDAEYLRTALHLLGAAELLFTQYESDVRIQANPAGVVGLTATMHGNIERSVMFNKPQKPLTQFITDSRAQYLTSLGLGTPFSKDDGRSRRSGRRGRSYFRGRRFYSQGMGRSQQAENDMLAATATVDAPSTRGRGACYAYQAGMCRRGRSCRFEHPNQ